MQQYCKNKLAKAKVFHLPHVTAEMVRFDLSRTDPEIPYADDSGQYYDFHSIRYQTASLLAMNPDTPEVVRQKAMRHKTSAMTQKYSHAFEDQQREAIEALPDLTQPSRESQRAVKTGTDDDFLSESCFEGAKVRSNTGSSGKQTGLNTQKPLLEDCSDTPGHYNVTPTAQEKPANQPANSDSQQTEEKLAPNLFSDSELAPDLKLVIDRWPKLSVELRAAIGRMVR